MRATARTRRSALPAELGRILSALATARILRWPPFHDANAVMAFASYSTEIDTTPLLRQTLGLGKQLVLPVVASGQRRLELRAVTDLCNLRPGKWGIPEPGPECPAVAIADIGLIVVPGLAFDGYGHRTGYGGGFYDRLLRERQRAGRGGVRLPLACGFGYEVQVVKQVPAGPEDERLDALCTDAALRVFDRGPTGVGTGYRLT